MPLSIAVNSDWLEERLPAFRTHLHYVSSIDHLIRQYHGDGELLDFGTLAANIRSRPEFKKIRPRRRARRLYEKELRNAWFTEVALNAPAIQGAHDMIPYMNHWGTVMAYYVLHLATCAALVAEDGQRPPQPSHDWALSGASALVATRRIFPPPWSAFCVGHEEACVHHGLPPGIETTCPSLLSTFRPEHAWGSLCRALVTTRRTLIKRRIKGWRNQHKVGRMRRAERCAVGAAFRSVTIFDFLYILRLSSSYRDADRFAAALRRPTDARQFNDSLRAVVASSMMLWEIFIAAMVGSDELSKLARETINAIPMASQTVGKRMSCWGK